MGTYRHASLLRVNNAATAWSWLSDHPAFQTGTKSKYSLFDFCLTIGPMLVDSKTRRTGRGTAPKVVEYWLECGPAPSVWPGTLIHDPRLDCGDSDFEKALLKLVRRVKKAYGDYAKCAECRGSGKVQKDRKEELISFEKNTNGGYGTVRFAQRVRCKTCKGSGYSKGSYPTDAVRIADQGGMPFPFMRAILLPPKKRKAVTSKNKK